MKQERLVNYGRDGIATVRITWHVRPPYYTGAVPFTYLAGISDYGVEYGIRSVVWADFDRFKINFLINRAFSPVIPGVARAVGTGGKVLAEARATRLIKGTGFEAQETHFDAGGHIVFACRSLFDFNGWKIDETDAHGEKTEEYFFLWSSDR
jgi:hypothetical protein